MIVYDGDARHLIAIHEAGHAVAYLLLGHHVIRTGVNVVNNGNGTETADGLTQNVALSATALAGLVATAAGEVAARRFLDDEGHPDAAMHARDGGVHDREHVQRLLAEAPSLPAHIGPALAALLLAEHWDAVQRLARAICEAPGHHLDANGILAAAALGDVEVTWEQLSDMARDAAPGSWGVEAYLFGPGRQDEEDRAEFLARLRAYDLLATPATGLRRQVNAEVYDRGFEQLQIELAAARDTCEVTR